jgi:hypothetical protein
LLTSICPFILCAPIYLIRVYFFRGIPKTCGATSQRIVSSFGGRQQVILDWWLLPQVHISDLNLCNRVYGAPESLNSCGFQHCRGNVEVHTRWVRHKIGPFGSPATSL